MDDQRTNRESGGSVNVIERHRFQFGLSAMLLLVAAISSFLGYAQWKRQTILREAKELEAHGVSLQLRYRWANLIWPAVEKDAKLNFQYTRDRKLVVGSKTYDRKKEEKKIIADAQPLYNRLDELGVENLDAVGNGKPAGRATVKSLMQPPK